MSEYKVEVEELSKELESRFSETQKWLHAARDSKFQVGKFFEILGGDESFSKSDSEM